MLPKKGTGWSAIALGLAVVLTGAPTALSSAFEPEHRCRCPAGRHACACPRCAAKVRHAAATTAKGSCHGRAGTPVPAAVATGLRPPCHGGARTPPADEPDPLPPPSGAPCVSAACDGTGAVATGGGGAEPFVLREHRAPLPKGEPEGFATLAALTAADSPAPEPPPPRA